jgi:hypothetical protein
LLTAYRAVAWIAPGLSEGDHCAVDLIDQLPVFVDMAWRFRSGRDWLPATRAVQLAMSALSQ